MNNTLNKILSEIELKLRDFLSQDDLNLAVNILKNNLPEETNLYASESKISQEKLYEKTSKLNLLRFLTFIENKIPQLYYVNYLREIGNYAFLNSNFVLAELIYLRIIIQSENIEENFRNIGNAFLKLGDINRMQADWEKTLNYISKAKEYFEKINDIYGLAKSENILGAMYAERGEIITAKSCFETSLSLLEKNKDEKLEGMLQINLGIMNTIIEDFDAAFDYLQNALNIFNINHDEKRLAQVYHNFGMLYLNKEEFDNAINDFNKAILHSEKIHLTSVIAFSLIGKALAFCKKKEFSVALLKCDKAFELCVANNDELSLADIYKIKGIIHSELGNNEIAENYLMTSLEMNKNLNNKLNYAESSFELGLHYKKIKSEKAKDFLLQSLSYFRKFGAEKKSNLIEQMV